MGEGPRGTGGPSDPVIIVMELVSLGTWSVKTEDLQRQLETLLLVPRICL